MAESNVQGFESSLLGRGGGTIIWLGDLIQNEGIGSNIHHIHLLPYISSCQLSSEVEFHVSVFAG